MITGEAVREWFRESVGKTRKRQIPSIADCEVIARFVAPSQQNEVWEAYAARVLEAREHAGQLIKSLTAARRLYDKLDTSRPEFPGNFGQIIEELETFQVFSDLRPSLEIAIFAHSCELLPPIIQGLENCGWKTVSATSDTSIALAVLSRALSAMFGDDAPAAATLARRFREQKAYEKRVKGRQRNL